MFKLDHVRLCLKHFVSQANQANEYSFNRYKFVEDDNWLSVVCNELFVSSAVISCLPAYLLRHLSIACHDDKIYLRFEKSDFSLS